MKPPAGSAFATIKNKAIRPSKFIFPRIYCRQPLMYSDPVGSSLNLNYIWLFLPFDSWWPHENTFESKLFNWIFITMISSKGWFQTYSYWFANIWILELHIIRFAIKILDSRMYKESKKYVHILLLALSATLELPMLKKRIFKIGSCYVIIAAPIKFRYRTIVPVIYFIRWANPKFVFLEIRRSRDLIFFDFWLIFDSESDCIVEIPKFNFLNPIFV